MPDIIDGAVFRKRCRIGLSGIYFLCGTEDYTKHKSLLEARNSLGDDRMNCRRFWGSDESFSYSDVLDAAMSPPIFSDRKITEIYGIDYSAMKKDATEAFLSFIDGLIEYDSDDSAVVFCAGSEEFDAGSDKRPSSLLKTLSEKLTVVRFDTEERPKLLGWIKKHFITEGIAAEGGECSALIDRCGTSMYVLSGEVDKLCNYLKAHDKNKLTMADIELVASMNIESGTFDFANALLERNRDRTMELLGDMLRRKEKPELILASVSRVFCDIYIIGFLSSRGISSSAISSKLKMHEYRVKLYGKAAAKSSLAALEKTISRCYDTDSKIKSSALDKNILLDTLVCTLLLGK